MKILIRGQKDKQWHLVESAAYGNEAALQHLLAESPSLISLDEVRPQAGALVCAIQEFNLPIGSIDLLAFTARGDIAIVECKLATNQDIKRKVIGQVLEYGANLWGMRYEELDAGIRMRTGENLADQVQKMVDEPEWDEEEFRSNVDAALVSGNFMLIIVVDEIDDDLARIVQFINACGNPSFNFAALEMRRFQAENSEMLVPRIFGPVRSTKTNPNAAPGKQWDEVTFFEEFIQRNGQVVNKVARQILNWASQNTRIWWGRGSSSGSFVPVIDHNGTKNQLMAIYTYGSVEIYFYWMSQKPPFDHVEKRLNLRNKLNQIPGVNIPEEAINRRPSIKLSVLEKTNGTEQFLSIFDWVIQEIKAS